MSKQGMKWKITQAFSAIMMVGFLCSFGGVTGAMAGDDPCAKLNEDMIKAAQASGATKSAKMMDAVGEFAEKTANGNGDKWQGLFGDAGEAYCIYKYMSWYNAIAGLLSGSWAAFYSLITTKIMARACKAAATVLNNVLDTVCIPVDHLSFGLGLPTVARETCSGFSLTDVGGYGQAPVMELFEVPKELRHLPISRGEDRL